MERLDPVKIEGFFKFIIFWFKNIQITMSTAPITFHAGTTSTPFHHNIFTSTLHEHEHEKRGPSLFNMWLVIITAMFFFTILSWYNFLLALFNVYSNPNESDSELLKNEVLATLVFAFLWTLLVIIAYLTFESYGFLSMGEPEEYWKEHPSGGEAKGEIRDVSRTVGRIGAL